MSGPSQAPPASRRRLWAVNFLVAYVALALPLWYNAVRVPRVPLPHDEIASLETAVADPLAAALPSVLTAYVLCAGPTYGCLAGREVSAYAQQLGEAVLREAGRSPAKAPLVVRVVNEAPGSCSVSSWASPGEEARSAALHRSGGSSSGSSASDSGGVGCLDLTSSNKRMHGALAKEGRDLDDWTGEQLAGHDRPGHYFMFVFPDPWMAADGLPYGTVGRRRFAVVRHPPTAKPSAAAAVRLAAMAAAPAFASHLGDSSAADPSRRDADADADNDEAQPLPLSPAAQLHLSFSLCNAHPSPHHGGGDASGNGGGNASGGAGSTSGSTSSNDNGAAGPPDAAAASASFAAFTWNFPMWEAQYVAPLKQLLAPAARLTVSSQVLYFTPARVNGTWDASRRAFAVPHHQLRFFVDSDWPLDPGRTGLPASAAGGGEWPYDLAAVVAGSRAVAVGEALLPPMPPPRTAARAAAEAATAAAMPRLLPPPAAESLPPAVLHFVLYAPAPLQRPLQLLRPDGEPAPANSFHVPGWGMLQVLNQVPGAGLILSNVESLNMESFAIEMVTQLRTLLGLGAARRRLLRHNALHAADATAAKPSNATSTSSDASDSGASSSSSSSASSSSNSSNPTELPPVGRLEVLSALRSGLAPWEADALLRRRTRGDAVAAAATLGSLARLLRQVPTLAVPPHVGALVRDAAAALRRALRLAAEGAYLEASRAAQEARSWAEAAFSDPALSSRRNVPDTHLVGVYLPFCLPAAVPLLQALMSEIRRRRSRKAQATRKGRGGVATEGGTAAGVIEDGGNDHCGAEAAPEAQLDGTDS